MKKMKLLFGLLVVGFVFAGCSAKQDQGTMQRGRRQTSTAQYDSARGNNGNNEQNKVAQGEASDDELAGVILDALSYDEEKQGSGSSGGSVDIEKLRKEWARFIRSAGPGLLASDIWEINAAQPLVGHNSQPAAVALFNELTRYLRKTLAGSGFPAVEDYYLLNLEGGNIVVILDVGNNYLWGMLVDKKKLPPGMLLSVVVANSLPRIREAMF